MPIGQIDNHHKNFFFYIKNKFYTKILSDLKFEITNTRQSKQRRVGKKSKQEC